jgi:hypothetical protein
MFRGNRSSEDLTLTDVNGEFASILYILIPTGKKIGTRVVYKMLLSDYKVGENWLLGE